VVKNGEAAYFVPFVPFVVNKNGEATYFVSLCAFCG
jgi:hypothetical protein